MILLVTPPFVQLNTPYPATPSLVGFLSARGIECTQRDLSLEVALAVLAEYGDDETDEAIAILQDPSVPDDDKLEATAVVEALAQTIRDEVDPDFGFSRYAERLGVAVPDFRALLRRMRRKNAVDRILEAKVAEALREVKPEVVGVTCPFPGTLVGAFRVAQTVRRLAPGVRIVLGGGYVNTELRELNDDRVGRFFDVVMYDEGYAPWLEFLAQDAARIPAFVKPSYAGLDLARYMDLPESSNPMHRMWSTGRWLKLQMARGCYWHRCAFCDVTLDYIKCFEMPEAGTIVDAMESLAKETAAARAARAPYRNGRSVAGNGHPVAEQIPSFHFTDEAMPPALIERVCREILKRKFVCRWWGNIRFDTAFTPALVRLMARAGCVAVTGGLECAVDRLLALMNKGITLASARQALASFRNAGILVHAYLMYGFPTETEREAYAALREVRDLFKAGLIQSAFFHRFALTVHSPIARTPAQFGIEPVPPPHARRIFARNEIPFREDAAPDWTRIGRGLDLALYNFMQGRGFSKSISFWFRRHCHTVILANGAPPTHPCAREILEGAGRVVCCDGALATARALGREPDLVVGDGDSLSPSERDSLGDRLVQIDEQETNDLDKAFRTVVERFGAEDCVILGADGRREDHFLGNLFRLPGFAEIAPDIELVTNEGRFTVVRGERSYWCRPGEAVSVFAPDPATHAESRGLEWPLDGVALDTLFRATLNRTTGNAFAVRSDRPLIVYQLI